MANKAYMNGFNDGRADAKAGKGKSYRGMGRGFLKLNFDDYAKQYSSGYDEGYRLGLRC